MSTAATLDASVLADLAPLIRRAVDLDPGSIARLRVQPGAAMALVRLPFGVLVGRRVAGYFSDSHDGSYLARELLDWLDRDADRDADPPARRDDAWRVAVPPESGWRRIDTVPDGVIRGLVRQGALTLSEAADREGLPGAQPRAEVADALLDSFVLTVAGGGARAEVSLRQLSALVRMGFLARESHLAVDVAGRWLRLAATYGSVYAERDGLALGLLRPNPHPHRGIGR